MKRNQVERGQKLGNTQETKHFWAILNNAAVPTYSFIDVHVKQFQYEWVEMEKCSSKVVLI